MNDTFATLARVKIVASSQDFSKNICFGLLHWIYFESVPSKMLKLNILSVVLAG